MHSPVPHHDSVADSDGGNDHGRTSGRINASFSRLGQFVQMDVTGNDLTGRKRHRSKAFGARSL